MTITLPTARPDPRTYLKGFDGAGAPVSRRVGIEEIIFKGRFGALSRSTSQNDISAGDKYVTLDFNPDNFRIGDDMLMTSLDDFECFMWGSIIGKDTVAEPARIYVFFHDISGKTGTFNNWECQVVARPKFGIVNDVSTGSIDPTAAGPWTIPATAGKFFPIDGKLILHPNADLSKVLLAKVRAFDGTNLTISKVRTNVTVSQTYSAWLIGLLDAPQDKIQKYAINGLRVTVNATDSANDIDTSAGSVRDSRDEIDLILPAGITKRLDAVFAAGANQGAQVLSANLAGTVSSAGANVTGTGTALTTDFATTLTDYVDQETVWRGTAPAIAPSIITTADNIVREITPSTATAATTDAALSASNDTYKRGGIVTALATDYSYAICIGRKDSDGSTDIFAAALTGTGTPDMPTGYTHYRVIARVEKRAFQITSIEQPLKGINANSAAEVRVDGAGFINEPLLGETNVQGALQAISDFLAAINLGTGSFFYSDAYTPALTAVLNLDANPPGQVCMFMQMGSYVIVYGRTNVNPTAAGAAQFRVSLPVPSNIGSSLHIHGTAAGVGQGGEDGTISGDAANDEAVVDFIAVNTVNHGYYFNFMYRVL